MIGCRARKVGEDLGRLGEARRRLGRSGGGRGRAMAPQPLLSETKRRERDMKDGAAGGEEERECMDAEEEECVSVVEKSMTGRKQEERVEAGG